MGRLKKEDIKAAHEEVHVEAWGGEVLIRAMSPAEADRYVLAYKETPLTAMAEVAAKCIVEPNFDGPEDFEGMLDGVIEVFKLIQDHTGIGKKDAVKEAKGNSEATQSDSSSTD